MGYAIGDRDLIRHVKNAHIILSFTTAGPVQVAAAVGLEEAERNGFWESNREVMRGKIGSLCKTFEDLGLPVSPLRWRSRMITKVAGVVCEAYGSTLCAA